MVAFPRRRWREYGRGAIEALRHVPGPAGLFCFCLQIAPREIDADGVTEDHGGCVTRLHFGAARAERDDEFNLGSEPISRAWSA